VRAIRASRGRPVDLAKTYGVVAKTVKSIRDFKTRRYVV
jgi:hypothetical protein